MSTALGHTSTGTQKRYINPDQNKQDLLQIEVIERFDVRKIVQNIIATCQQKTLIFLLFSYLTLFEDG